MVDDRPPCPGKGKRRFQDEAEATLGHVWATGYRRGSGRLPCRSYACQCGYWHLTSKPLDRSYPRPGEVVSDFDRPMREML